jgi:hypothetical protein
MSRIACAIVLFAMTLSLAATESAYARPPKKYQVTGKVLEVTEDFIAVDKAGDRWEVGRDASTKVTGNLKVGAKVTIEYTMSASKVEAPASK